MSQKQLTACPAPESLVHWQQGKLAPHEVEYLIDHVETCTICLNTLEVLAADDPIARHLRQEPPTVNDDDKAELAALERRMRGVGPSTDATARLDRDSAFHFLSPPQNDDEIGRLGTYRVLRVLGTGGMGVVYQAEDPGLKRIVAIKAMLPAIAASDSAKKRFLREARAAAAIKHNHIVTIFQIGEEGGVPFLAMEFLEGESLDDRLQRKVALPLAETLRIGREMSEGLAAAHALGLIHRDIKPGNTWLEGKKGHVKILDFGLARSTTHDANLTQSGAIVGTPAYMAPEQGNGDQPDARSDLWSLGVVLYRMATGELPFKGRDTLSTLKAVALHNPLPPMQINAQIPAGLSNLVMKLLEKDPAKRIASAHEVAEALRELDRPGLATDALRRPKARNLVLLTLAGGLVAALIAAIFICRPRAEDAGVQGKHDPQNPPDRAIKAAPATVPKEKTDPPAAATPPGPRILSIVHQFQHAGPIASVALSRDGKRVITGSWDNTAILWDTVTGKHLQTFQGHTQAVTSVAFSGDGKQVLTGSWDKTAILWDAINAKQIQIFQGHTLGINCVALSGDAKHVLTGSGDKTAILWESAGGTPIQIFHGHTEEILGVALGVDGKRILTGSSDRAAILWDVFSGKQHRIFQGHAGPVTSVALSMDGKQVLTGAWDHPAGAILWDADNGRPIKTYQGHTTGVKGVALSANAKLILTGSADKTGILTEADHGKHLQILKGHADRVTCVAMSGDGDQLLTGSDDKTAILWKIHGPPPTP